MTLCDAGNASMAYFYFDFRDVDKQKLSNSLPSLLTQFLLGLIPVAIYSLDSILYTIAENGNPAIAL
jgi:hypothetical protein